MRRLLAILLPGLLLLTACGGGEPAAPEPSSQSAGETAKLDSLKLTENGDKKAPGVEFTKPLDVKEPIIKVVSEGSGDPLKPNQVAEVSVAGFNGNDGKTLGDTFAEEPQAFELNEELKTGNPALYNAFVGALVGSQIAVVSPGQAAAGGAAAVPTQLLIVKVVSAKDAPRALSQEETDKLDKDGKLPKVTFDEKGAPSVEIPKMDAPTGLSVKVLSEGSGDKVGATDRIEANYTGWRWEDGSKFDSSYDRGEPSTFGLTEVIRGWTLGLTDQKVGSKLLLTIPEDLAYGKTAAAQGKPAGPLVFVVEIKAKK
ncbi:MULTISPECIES: FKBP-type peptidyl-prolyl cis-trans isomerase [unclassified Arthrobacter]|uniref:FKBP-type peptidyl-prolyl cis-trans isomerase n=1 Tax=unclassified Arthrobacter TaxID=235627 RepID=UPI001CFF5733|nr:MULTISPECIES: FKBP-type peptidyl-prolyl cis-trans isomerase [unclassified Arthrobacter]MCB5283275.1 FKBP-type 22 kDa peptidyl-prolyl cis-trans isomerase [Arthrobacter sp. ES1]WGZ81144.1 FKBP-type peptidyl-prolyl cis-trans isomerase [Arthrobacter sp. EM1]